MGQYKARTEFLNKSILEATSEEDKRLLSVGFIPESYRGEYERFMAKNVDATIPDPDLDKISNGNYFAFNPDRVFGTIKAGSGFLNPILVKGTLEGVVEGLEKILSQPSNKSFEKQEPISSEPQEETEEKYTAIDALKDFASKSTNKAFLSAIESGSFGNQYDISFNKLKKALLLVPGDQPGNIKKLNDFYNKEGKEAKKDSGQTEVELLEKELFEKFSIKIKSARKYKSSTCTDAYNFVEKQQEYCFEVTFTDNKKAWYGTAISRDMAIIKAITERLPKTQEVEVKPEEPMAQSHISSTPVSETPEVVFTTADLSIIQKNKLVDDDIPKNKTITVEESIKLYNTGISDDEIKAWVWYKRQFGNPMNGWENYFIGGKNKETNILVKTTRDTTIKDNTYRDTAVIPGGVTLGKKTKFSHEYKGDTFIIVRTETNELVWVNKKDVVDIKNRTEAPQEEIDRLVNLGVLIFDGGDYFPLPVFLFGDIYKRLKTLKDNATIITEKYGVEVYEKLITLVESYKPKMRSFREKVKSLRPHILSLSAFAQNAEEFGVLALNDEEGVKLGKTVRNRFQETEEKLSLFEAFKTWFQETVKDTDLKNTTKANVALYYWAKSIRWEKDSKGNDILTQAQKDERVGSARIASEEQFSEFLSVALTYEDAVRLDVIWNERYNAFTNINQFVDKVPVAYAGSTMFKNGALSIRAAQRHGLAFLQLTGSGCVSYDVGFGKTLVGILNLAQLMSQGKVKRPLVVVPKPTYKNWLRELFGYWTDGEKTDFKEFPGSSYHYGILSGSNLKLNEWFNLSGNHYKKLLADNNGDLNKTIPENTITVVSYKGFEQMGFSRDVSEELITSIAAVLQQKETFKDVKEELGFMENVRGWLGLGNKNAVIMVDKVGFDHITVDEAHNFKNVFPACGKDPETGRKLFGISGSQSTRAVKMFFVTQFLQRNYGKNVVLLTATPFTNSPLEMYSMLSFIGLDTLNNYNLYNIKKFFENFILETIEYAINVKGEIITKPVIKSFKNLKLLQTILYNHFDYKDNPKEAGVVRPCLVQLPNNETTTYIEMNDWQKKNQLAVKEMAKSVSRTNPGAVLKAISMSLDNALTPYLFSNEEPESAEEFVNNSPKIKYAIGCIKSVKDWHELRGEDVSGQIIYSNRGKQYFEYIKEFLCSKAVGFKRKIQYEDELLDEVEIITGGGSEAEEDHKELVKDAFNAGIVKIVIGTAAIREGVNLQSRGTVIYDLYPEWNPTDIHQLKGRIWRQGNRWGYVRFVMPLVINSMDNFIYQKQDEKSKRISSLWNSLGESNVEELTSELDPSEIKYELVEDATEKFKIKHDSIYKEAQRSLEVAKEKQSIIKDIDYEINQLRENVDSMYGDLKVKSTKWAEYLKLLKGKVTFIVKKNNADAKFNKKITDSIDRTQLLLKDFSDFEATNKSDITILLKVCRDLKMKDFYLEADYSNWQRSIDELITDYEYEFRGPNDWEVNQLKGYFTTVRKAERSVLGAYDLTWTDDLTKVVKDLDAQVDEAQAYMDSLNDEKYKDKLMKQIEAEITAKKALRGDINSQIDKFIALNYLLSYLSDNTDKEKCKMPTEPCCATNGLDVIYKDITPAGEVVSEEEFVEPKVYTIAEYESLLKGLRAVMKFKTDEKEKSDYAKMIKALEAVIKIKSKHDKGGILSYGAGGPLCGCGHGEDDQYAAGGPLTDETQREIEEIQAKLEEYVPPFEFDDYEVDSEYRPQTEEYNVWIEFEGVSPEVIASFDLKHTMEMYNDHFRDWNQTHNLNFEQILVNEETNSVLYMITLIPKMGAGGNAGVISLQNKVRQNNHGFTAIQTKNIIKIVQGIEEQLSGKFDSWTSGGDFAHMALQLKDNRWLIFHSMTGQVTVTSVPYATEAEIYDAFGDEPENTTSLIIEGLEDEDFSRTLKIINSIKDNTFVSMMPASA